MNRLSPHTPVYIGCAKTTRLTAGKVDPGTIPGRSKRTKRVATIDEPRKKRTRRR